MLRRVSLTWIEEQCRPDLTVHQEDFQATSLREPLLDWGEHLVEIDLP